MPRKVSQKRRDKVPTLWVHPGDNVELLDSARVAVVAERHGLRGGYDLYGALNETAKIAFKEAYFRDKAPTLAQRWAYYNEVAKYATRLEPLLDEMPHQVEFDFRRKWEPHRTKERWLSRLRDDIRSLRVAAELNIRDAYKPDDRTPDPVRQILLQRLIQIYEEGTGKPAKGPSWNDCASAYCGPVLRLIRDCLAVVLKSEVGRRIGRFGSRGSLAQAVKREIKNKVKPPQKKNNPTL